MNIKKFLRKLDEFYNEVGKTEYSVKFFLQNSTFHFEIHDNRKKRFTSESLVFVSDVYWWESHGERSFIVNVIRDKCKELRKNWKKIPIWIPELKRPLKKGAIAYPLQRTLGEHMEIPEESRTTMFFYSFAACKNWCDNNPYKKLPK